MVRLRRGQLQKSEHFHLQTGFQVARCGGKPSQKECTRQGSQRSLKPAWTAVGDRRWTDRRRRSQSGKAEEASATHAQVAPQRQTGSMQAEGGAGPPEGMPWEVAELRAQRTRGPPLNGEGSEEPRRRRVEVLPTWSLALAPALLLLLFVLGESSDPLDTPHLQAGFPVIFICRLRI